MYSLGNSVVDELVLREDGDGLFQHARDVGRRVLADRARAVLQRREGLAHQVSVRLLCRITIQTL